MNYTFYFYKNLKNSLMKLTLFGISKLVQMYMRLRPHSSGPKRTMSVHTILKTSEQSSYSRNTLNSRMYIALNGVSTTFVDPRPAVIRFFKATKEGENFLMKFTSYIQVIPLM